MEVETGILTNIKLKHSPVETMKLLKKLWGMDMCNAKRLTDYVIKKRVLNLCKGFHYMIDGWEYHRYDINPKQIEHIFDGIFIKVETPHKMSTGLTISKCYPPRNEQEFYSS